jgi:hypothetical protein
MTRLAAVHDAINLGQGYPDFPAPEEVKEAARRAIAENRGTCTPGSELKLAELQLDDLHVEYILGPAEDRRGEVAQGRVAREQARGHDRERSSAQFGCVSSDESFTSTLYPA